MTWAGARLPRHRGDDRSARRRRARSAARREVRPRTVARSPARRCALSGGAVPEDVRRLLQASIRSIAELELLLALRRDHSRAWTAAEAAGALGLETKATERMLFDLMARGLLTVSRVPPLAYRFSPRTPELRATVGRLGELYAAHRLAIASLVDQRPDESLRRFSDAFRLWSDE
jgi:hypothetical protein